MRRLINTLIFFLFLTIFAAAAALVLIPDRFEQAWRGAGLPPAPLTQAQTWLGQTPLAETDEVRLYGQLEAREQFVMSEIGGRATAVLVEEGDAVGAGQALIALDDAVILAEVAAAEQTLNAAVAARDAVAEPPADAVVAVAEQTVAAAQTRLANARRKLVQAQDNLARPQSLDAEINRVQALIPAAQAAGGRAEAGISQIEVLLEQARTDGSREGKFQQSLLERQKAAAEAELEANQAQLAGLQRTLSLLRAIRRQPLALQAQVHAAESEVQVMEAALTVAQAEYDLAAQPPAPEAVAVADAQVQKAEAALELARWQAERTTIRAPQDGQTLARLIEPGETISPGTPLLSLADLGELELRVYITQQDLQNIRIGDMLPVRISGVSDAPAEAEVFFIAAEAQFRPTNVLNPDDRGDMVFLTKLRLPNPNGVLKPGMPADVIIVPHLSS